MDGWEIRVRRYASETVNGQVVYRRAPRWLSPHVLGYSGWQVDMTLPIQRRLVPFGGVSVLLDFVPPIRESVLGVRHRFHFPVAGMHDGPIVFRQAGRHFGVGVGLTPAGAYALFGTPMHELTNAVVELSDLIGNRAEQLTERLAQAPSWPARFALLNDSPAQMDSGRPCAAG